jgi:hypothetical protein
MGKPLPITEAELSAMTMLDALMRQSIEKQKAHATTLAAYWTDQRQRVRDLKLAAELLREIAKKAEHRAGVIRRR